MFAICLTRMWLSSTCLSTRSTLLIPDAFCFNLTWSARLWRQNYDNILKDISKFFCDFVSYHFHHSLKTSYQAQPKSQTLSFLFWSLQQLHPHNCFLVDSLHLLFVGIHEAFSAVNMVSYLAACKSLEAPSMRIRTFVS